jgi:hypothetical protein
VCEFNSYDIHDANIQQTKKGHQPPYNGLLEFRLKCQKKKCVSFQTEWGVRGVNPPTNTSQVALGETMGSTGELGDLQGN